MMNTHQTQSLSLCGSKSPTWIWNKKFEPYLDLGLQICEVSGNFRERERGKVSSQFGQHSWEWGGIYRGLYEEGVWTLRQSDRWFGKSGDTWSAEMELYFSGGLPRGWWGWNKTEMFYVDLCIIVSSSSLRKILMLLSLFRESWLGESKSKICFLGCPEVKCENEIDQMRKT